MLRAVEPLAESALAGALGLLERLDRNPRVAALLHAARNRRSYNLTIHDLMLADRRRMNAYARGIAANVQPGDVVLDLGTGTGILGCMAAAQGARKVYAIDHDSVDIARALAEANGLSNIEFHQVHSERFEPPEQVDVIIHELIGDRIFDERMIPDIPSLRDRVLRRGGRILPNRVDTYLEPVEVDERGRVPLLWEHVISGIDYSALRALAMSKGRYPVPMAIRPDLVATLLCAPEPAFSIDLEVVSSGPTETRVSRRRQVRTAGWEHGLVMFFVAHFDVENRLSNAPPAAAAADALLDMERSQIHHWYPVLLRTEARERGVGAEIQVRFETDELERPERWRWGVT
jgi:protein arginine N-methyltransferase 1